MNSIACDARHYYKLKWFNVSLPTATTKASPRIANLIGFRKTISARIQVGKSCAGRPTKECKLNR